MYPALALAAFLTGSACSPGTGGTPSHVILISVDTLRADHIGSYGHPGGLTPAIDEFAAGAMVFERCLSHAPVTGSSLASLLSGYLPHETGVFENWPLSAEVETLPEMLKNEGFTTLAVISNFMLAEGNGWEQGFDVYDRTMTGREQVRRLPERTAADTTAKAVELLQGSAGERTFLWVHYQDPHGPYTPPEAFVVGGRNETPPLLRVNRTVSGRGGIPSYQFLGSRAAGFYASRYQGEVRFLDENVSRLLDTLKDLDMYEDSLIILTADHGEGMGEKNYWFAHGENLSTALTHVPLVIRWGEKLRGRSGAFVQHLDLVPTILEALEMRPDPRLRGSSLLKPVPGDREIFAEMRSPVNRDGNKYSLVRGGLKLVYTPLNDSYELFDLGSDFREEHDLMADMEDKAAFAELKRRLVEISTEDRLGIATKSAPPPVSDDMLKKMRSLGYIQ